MTLTDSNSLWETLGDRIEDYSKIGFYHAVIPLELDKKEGHRSSSFDRLIETQILAAKQNRGIFDSRPSKPLAMGRIHGQTAWGFKGIWARLINSVGDLF